MRDGEGCFDINECIEKNSCTKKNTFCVNNEGSFSCLECDKSCEGCDGDGPDMCEKCANGYELRDGMCTGKFKLIKKHSNEKNLKFLSFDHRFNQ